MKKRFYGKGIPGIDTEELKGSLIVIEGGDGAGRSTQIALLKSYIERRGFPCAETGLKRSTLVGPELGAAMQGNTLLPITFSLFYATDLADRLENNIIPALRAGFVVLADRYIYTPMVRDIVRGVRPDWVRDVYSMALVPDLTIYLKASPKVLAARSFHKTGTLDYWESGMDIQASGDMYQCFIRYQGWCQKEFNQMIPEYDFKVVDGNRTPSGVQKEIRGLVDDLLRPKGERVASAG
jgi:dTMP kinase